MFNRSFFTNLPPVTKNIFIINIIIWALAALGPGSVSIKIVDTLGLHYFTSHGFRIWQPLTYMFVQVDFFHLLFNMWALLMFGYAIERTLGSRRFLFFYLTCGFGAALVQMAVYAIAIHHAEALMDPRLVAMVHDEGWETLLSNQQYVNSQAASLNVLLNSATIGASGAVFGLLLAVAMLFPDSKMYIFFIPYPIKAKWMVLGYGLIELSLGLGTVDDGVAHFAHLGGMLFAFLLLWYWKNQFKRNGRY